MELSVHRKITRAILPSGPWHSCKCCDGADEEELRPRQEVYEANLGQDNVCTGQNHNEYHGDNSAFSQLRTFIAGQWAVVRTHDAMIMCCECEHMRGALQAFGRLLHSIQDFYSHSAWVELHRDDGSNPLWDPEAGKDPGVVSGTWPLGTATGPTGSPSHGDLNKDSNDKPEGGRVIPSGPNQGKTLHELAVEYAKAASADAFAKFRSRAPRTVACIEQAGGPHCADCKRRARLAREALRSREGIAPVPLHGTLGRPTIGEPHPADLERAERALRQASECVRQGREVPSGLYRSLEGVSLASIHARSLAALEQLERVATFADAVTLPEYTDAVVLIEAYRLTAPLELSSLIRTGYDAAITPAVAGLLLSAALRYPGKAMIPFLLDRITDERVVSREARAYDWAICRLERLFGDEFDVDDPADADARAGLHQRWAKGC